MEMNPTEITDVTPEGNPEAEAAEAAAAIEAERAAAAQVVAEAKKAEAERGFANPNERGFPVALEDGTLVTIVAKEPDPQLGTILVADDGRRFATVPGASTVAPVE